MSLSAATVVEISTDRLSPKAAQNSIENSSVSPRKLLASRPGLSPFTLIWKLRLYEPIYYYPIAREVELSHTGMLERALHLLRGRSPLFITGFLCSYIVLSGPFAVCFACILTGVVALFFMFISFLPLAGITDCMIIQPLRAVCSGELQLSQLQLPNWKSAAAALTPYYNWHRECSHFFWSLLMIEIIFESAGIMISALLGIVLFLFGSKCNVNGGVDAPRSCMHHVLSWVGNFLRVRYAVGLTLNLSWVVFESFRASAAVLFLVLLCANNTPCQKQKWQNQVTSGSKSRIRIK
jgi:hypothetical protein